MSDLPVLVKIEMSASLAALAGALAKAQGLMAGAKKDSTNPHFKSSYADLASIWDACRDPLSTNGLAVVQIPGSSGKDVEVTTLLLHSSGEFIRSSYTMPVTGPGPQGVGSAITYARRYSLAAMVGVAPEDDDGNAASAKPSPFEKGSVLPPLPPTAGKRTAEVKAQLSARKMPIAESEGAVWFEKIRELGKSHGIEGVRMVSHVKGCGITKTDPATYTEADYKTVAASMAYLEAGAAQ